MPILVSPPPADGPGTPGAVLQKRTLSIGDLRLGASDELGTLIYLTDLRGWDGSTDTTNESEQRVRDHGSWLREAYRPARIVEVDILLRGSSFATVSESLDLLASRIPLSKPEQMVVDNHGTIRTAKVRQGGKFQPAQKAASAVGSIVLIADDPFRYGLLPVTGSTGLPQTTGGLRLPTRAPFRINATTSAGILTVTNSGNAAASPTFTIQGPCPPFTLTHLGTGALLSYPEAVPAGRFVVIDTAQKTALLDGTTARYITGAWFTYARGENSVFFSAGTYSASALLTSVHFDAYL